MQLVARARRSLSDRNDDGLCPRYRPTWLQISRQVHSFRVFTVILAWFRIVAAFYEKPDLLTDAQRLIQRGIEEIGDTIPPSLYFVR